MSDNYQKPPTSISDQIALLQQRGLIIEHPAEAEQSLKHIGYYRLAGYWRIYQVDPVKHIFRSDATFGNIIALYNFDRELRLLLLDAIERIEVSFRAILVNEMCSKYSSTWFANPELAFNQEIFEDTLHTIDNELERSGEDFLKHHERKYGTDKYPPAWKTMQVLSFGTLSKIYGNIHNNITEKKEIARMYRLPTDAWLHSWMQVISVLRNYCAHHSRICYRIFSFPPKEMRRPKLPWIKNIPQAGGVLSQHLYYQLCAVGYILHTAAPGSQFSNNLKLLIEKYPGIDLNRMGFMPDWETEDLWTS